MVNSIRLYVEGGGQQAESKAQLRQGFSQFFTEIINNARRKGVQWTVVACGSRTKTYEMFRNAVLSYPEAFVVILVDSERPLASDGWKHLARYDRWKRNKALEDQAQLMVQCMEAWIVTDRDALRSFYGPRWVEKCLPSLTRTESVSPKELVKALENASRATQKGSYHKITHASRLLKLVKPSIVREHSASCRLFFECLEKRV